jgi:hypothetical protein
VTLTYGSTRSRRDEYGEDFLIACFNALLSGIAVSLSANGLQVPGIQGRAVPDKQSTDAVLFHIIQKIFKIFIIKAGWRQRQDHLVGGSTMVNGPFRGATDTGFWHVPSRMNYMPSSGLRVRSAFSLAFLRMKRFQ